jgi:type II secretory pathway pseudopilin PulG
MKLLSHLHRQSRLQPPARGGFTLVETMVSMWVFLIIFIGVMIGLQIYGLRVYTLGATKLSATECALKVLNHIRDDIRQAKTVNVGNLTTVSDPSTFVLTGNSNKNTGAALQIFPSTNATTWTVYYLDSSVATNYLKMATTTNGTSFSTPYVLATYITNLVVFDAEDFQGNILTNDSNNRIIRMELDFYQWEYPVGYVGGVGINAYDFYKLTTKISRRLID